MYKKILLILSITVIIACTSCNDDKLNDNRNQEQLKLKMNVLITDNITHSAINKFNEMNSNIKIEFKDIPQDEYFKNTDKLTTETLTGEGPDIYCGDTGAFPSIYKAALNGTFYDLDLLIKKDKQFRLNDYYDNIINCGQIDGKRYILPINFDLHIFYGFEKVLKNNNIVFNNNEFSWDNLSRMSIQFMAESKGKYFFTPMDFKTIFESYGKSFVDYKSKKANFEAKEFVDLLKTYKEVIPSICPSEYALKYQGMWWGMVKDNSLVLQQSYITNASYFWSEFNFGKNVLNSDIKIYPYPSYEGGNKSAAYVKNFVAINKNCKYKEEAFKFIKILLSKEIQKNDGIPSAPVNKEAYKEIISDYAGQYGSGKDLKNPATAKVYKSNPIPKALAESLASIPEKLEACDFVDRSILKIINDELKNFLNGNKSAEQTAKAINEKVSLFLNE